VGFDEPAMNEISTSGEDEVHGDASVVLFVLIDLSWEGVEASGFKEGRCVTTLLFRHLHVASCSFASCHAFFVCQMLVAFRCQLIAFMMFVAFRISDIFSASIVH
jgi:hypothetical protein